jgi:hypothetical protein
LFLLICQRTVTNVPPAGIEPALAFSANRILSPACLPISPQGLRAGLSRQSEELDTYLRTVRYSSCLFTELVQYASIPSCRACQSFQTHLLRGKELGCLFLRSQNRTRTCINFHSRVGYPSVYPIPPSDYKDPISAFSSHSGHGELPTGCCQGRIRTSTQRFNE